MKKFAFLLGVGIIASTVSCFADYHWAGPTYTFGCCSLTCQGSFNHCVDYTGKNTDPHSGDLVLITFNDGTTGNYVVESATESGRGGDMTVTEDLDDDGN